jgi:hypothetical protein
MEVSPGMVLRPLSLAPFVQSLWSARSVKLLVPTARAEALLVLSAALSVWVYLRPHVAVQADLHPRSCRGVPNTPVSFLLLSP